jgi:imidazolonepropionase-like amidohydrolase
MDNANRDCMGASVIMVPRLKWLFPLLMAALLVPLGADLFAAGSDKLAVKAGRIIPVEGEEIEQGIILMEGGKITAVGKDLEIPYDFWVVDASSSVAFPGMVEPFTSRSIRETNENLPVTPFLDVYDSIDPSSTAFENALRDGTTTLLISQAERTVIGAVCRAVRPIGMTVDEMTQKEDAGLLLVFSPKPGYDRMMQMATFRETFRELEVYLENLAESKYEEKCKDEDKEVEVAPAEARTLGRPLIKDEDLDFKHLNLVRLKRGELTPFLYCAKPVDVAHAASFAKEQGFLHYSVFVVGNECCKAAGLLKGTGRPVILHPDMVYRKTDPLTGDESEIFVPRAFFDAGVPFALRSDPNSNFGMRYLWYQAARLVRNGIPRDTALKSITSTTAKAIGLGDQVGALKPGLAANVLILSGDPLDNQTWVEKVIVEGRVVYEKEKDYRLKELLTGEELGPESVEQDNGSDSEDEE